jgi:hypothetical protein
MNEPTRDLAEWDAEIEAEFQRVVVASKAVGRSKRRHRLIGCPVGFLADVCRLTEGRATTIVALCIYRRTYVCKSQTVTMPTAELAELGIDPSQKSRALDRLKAAGIIRTKTAPGRTTEVTLLWKPH